MQTITFLARTVFKNRKKRKETKKSRSSKQPKRKYDKKNDKKTKTKVMQINESSATKSKIKLP